MKDNIRGFFGRLNRTLILAYSLFLFAGTILIATIMFTMNVDVVKDWKLVVPSAEIHAGDTVVLKSEYTKLRSVTGKSIRYIECKNRAGVYVRYPLNEAVANRASGVGGTGIVVKVPTSIPDVPTTCKFTISVTYKVYPWREVLHTNSSQEFTLLEEREESMKPSGPVTIQENPIQGSEIAQASQGSSSQSRSSSSSNSTPTMDTAQQETSQPPMDAQPTPPENELEPTPEPVPDDRNVVERIIERVTGVL